MNQANEMGKKIARTASFPLLLLGALLAGFYLREAGIEDTLATLLVLGPVLAGLFVLERFIPYEREWNKNQGDQTQDLIHFVALLALGGATGALATGFVLFLGSHDLVALFRVWPREWPLPLQVGLALLAGDFIPYWIHRWSHEKGGFLWNVHSVHHAPARLYFLNTARFHPLNIVWNVFFKNLPALLLGAEASVLYFASLITLVHTFASHANIDFRLGFLNWVFSMTELHRFHHSRDLQEANSNYGGTLILWDVVFGTRKLPARRIQADEIGFEIEPPDYPRTYAGQAAYPFRRG